MKKITFADRVTIQVFAGNGGNGVATFRREKYVPRGGPDGGDGGNGGDVYLQASENETSLLSLFFQPLIRADHGERGRSKQMYGRAGENRIVPVPCGTVIYHADTGDYIGEVVQNGDTLLVAKGGRGGLGNMHFQTATHQTPREYTLGTEGEHYRLRLEMKSVAMVGLVGYPNAGKSTLLGALTPAHPKTAAYPFTTLFPCIGTLAYSDFATITIADIPGLIENAHKGAGLGHDFLRHIERTQFLLFVIDMAGEDHRDPADDFLHLRNELTLYSRALAERPYLVVANKMDDERAIKNIRAFRRKTGEKPLAVSAALGDGLEALKKALRKHCGAKSAR